MLLQKRITNRIKQELGGRLGYVRWRLRFARFLGLAQAIYFAGQRLRKAPIVSLKVQGVRTSVFCRPSSVDHVVLWQIFDERPFEGITLQKSPQLVIDGGANVGYASLYFANKYPNAQIIAVEPDTENCALFRRNCAVYPNIELIQGAIWTSNTDLVIENPAADSWAFRVGEVQSPTSSRVKGVTVGDILARSGKPHIDLLKLDIEGSEEQLFSLGYSDWLDRTENMAIEIHGPRYRDAVFAATEDYGFTVYQSGECTVFAKV